MSLRFTLGGALLSLALVSGPAFGQAKKGKPAPAPAAAAPQKIDEEYTKLIKEYLQDPRITTELQPRQLVKAGKPLYWANSGIHSPETGGPEMLIELAYRLIVEETPFIQTIRNNSITFITPVIEVDGREREVDTYYYNKRTGQRLPLM